MRILLAEDGDDIREGCRELLGDHADVELVAVVADGVEALVALDSHSVDIALLDVEMPRLDGIATAKATCDRHPGTRVVMLAAFRQDSGQVAAMVISAQGFLTTDMTVAEIVSSLHNVMAGRPALGPEPQRLVIGNNWAKAHPGTEHVAFLAVVSTRPPRLLAVYDGLSRGLTHREIARRSRPSEASVRTYTSEFYRLLGCCSRSEVALRAGAAQASLKASRAES